MKAHLRHLLLAAFALLAVCSVSAQALVGAWSFGDTTTDDSGVVVFFSNGYYVHVGDTTNDALPSGFDGYERGTYTWNGVNGTAFTATAIADTNGDTGLSSINNSTTTFSISGNSLTVTDADGLGTGSMVLSRVTGSPAIVGAWFDGDVTSPLSTNVGIFLPNGTYFLVTDRATDGAGHAGIERGTYLWNSGTGAFSSTTILDTNGDFGLSDPPLITNITVSGGIMTLTDSGGSNTLTAIPEPSTYATLAGLGALGLAFWRRRCKTV